MLLGAINQITKHNSVVQKQTLPFVSFKGNLKADSFEKTAAPDPMKSLNDLQIALVVGNDTEILGARVQYLQQNFPKTIAFLNSKL